MCFVPWFGKLLPTDVLTMTFASLHMTGETGEILIPLKWWKLRTHEGQMRDGPCPAPAPLRRRVRIAIPLLSPPPSSFGFSNLKPAAFPARAGAQRRERAGPRASQPRLGGSRPAPRMRPRPHARATRTRATAGGRSVGSSQHPVSRLSDPAERLSPGVGAVDRDRLGGKRRDGRGRAGQPQFPGAGPGRGGRGRGGPCVCGTVSVTLKQKWFRGCQGQHPRPSRSPAAVADMEPVASNIQVLLQAAEFLERRERGEDRPRARAGVGSQLGQSMARGQLARCLPHIHRSARASGQGVTGERVLAPKTFP